jgi:hypothetical protein
MKKYITAMLLLIVLSSNIQAQDEATTTSDVPNSLFRFSGIKSSGFYIAATNSFTSINGKFANMSGLYGGWFVNKKLLIGVGGAATNTALRVPERYKTEAGADMRYQYAQFGLMTEYVMNSNNKVHLAFNMLTGAGFTAQYIQDEWETFDDRHHYDHYDHDTNFFVVVEPGAQVEVNILRWMRLSTGVSYRQTFGSNAKGLSDGDLSNISGNVGLKFGRF